MDEDTYLIQLEHEYEKGEKICFWDFISNQQDDVRVFYKPNNLQGNGFSFFAVVYAGHVCVDNYENWDNENTMVGCMYHGWAQFDGIRHLYMGSSLTNDYGYHYYPEIQQNIDCLKIIQDLEKKFCREKSLTSSE